MRWCLNRYTFVIVCMLMCGGLAYLLKASAGGKTSGDVPATEFVKVSQVEQERAKREANEVHFRNSKDCALCHSNSDRATAMRDAKDRPVAPYDLWQASMMANSSRDPFWRAVLSAEVEATPSKKALIEEKCTRCHSPMAAPVPVSPDGEVLSYLKKQDRRAHLGLDGVSCTVCHQITPKGLGTDASFTGQFEINQDQEIYGPHADPFTMPMLRHVGYKPTHSNHILKSSLCATCHTVMTHSVDHAGNSTSKDAFHEQSPYLEWRNSDFNDEVKEPSSSAKSCQACHMPTTDQDGNPISTRLAHNPGGRDFPFLSPRQPFGQHAFLGANSLMKQILRDNRSELGVVASEEAFNRSIEQTRKFLGTQTAKLEMGEIQADDQRLTIPISVVNLSGHKLPTAYPSRRVWVRLEVTDEKGNRIFTSGQFNPQGELVDDQGEVLKSEFAGGPINPHHTVIRRSDEVQVYETIMGNARKQPTFTLLRAATYVKDNRLLPKGWSPDHPDGTATQPYGIGDDSDFSGGGDQVVYQVPIAQPGRFDVTATLLFQVITPRHANELFTHQTPEVTLFRGMYDRADRRPEVLADAKRSVRAK